MRTTVVGSYPAPRWLRSSLTQGNLRDAMMVALKTQELAGIELLGDGELYRWTTENSNQTCGYGCFARHLDGVRTLLTPAELAAWQANGRRRVGEPTGGDCRGRNRAGMHGPAGRLCSVSGPDDLSDQIHGRQSLRRSPVSSLILITAMCIY